MAANVPERHSESVKFTVAEAATAMPLKLHEMNSDNDSSVQVDSLIDSIVADLLIDDGI